MRRFTPLALTALLVLPLGACLGSKDAVTLKADGSGTIKSTYVVDLKKAEELVETASLLFPNLSGDQALQVNPTAPSWFRKFAGAVEGYTIDKAEEVTQEGKRTSTIEATFTSLEKAAKGGAFFSSKVRLDQDEQKRWVLTFKDSVANANELSGGFDVGAILPSFEAQLGTLEIVRTITLPTKILESNGTVSEDGKTVTFRVDFKRILVGTDLEMRVVFAPAEGLELTAFSHAPDVETLLKRFTEAAPKEAPVVTPEPGEGEESEEAPAPVVTPEHGDGDAPGEGDGEAPGGGMGG